MTNNPNQISRFWQELKRRRVIHVITVYASAAFVIIELAGNLTEPLNLPASLSSILIIVLAIGFPLAIILSWLYDLTGEGIRKTEPIDEVQGKQAVKVPNAWKIATFVSFVMIIGLVILNLAVRDKLVKPGSIQSLVILPFENFTGDDQLEYFVSGMHASLIGDMGRISGLRVIGRTSSNIFRGRDMSVPQIASELKVDAAVEASVMCLGNDTICLKLQVIKPFPEEKQIWVADYRVNRKDLLNWYNQATRQIADQMKVQLTPEEERLLAKSRAVERDAFDAYLRSQQYWGDFSPERFHDIKDYLNNAIEKDPDWAPLYLARANYWMWLVQWGLEQPSVALPIASKNLSQALELDPDLPGAHHLVGWIAFVSEWDWTKAEREFLKALAINPNDAESRIYYAHLLCVLDRQDEAIPQARLALELDPLNPLIQILYSTTQLFIDWCEADQTQIEKLLADDPNNYGANVVLNYLSSYCGDYETAIRTEKRMLQTILGEQFEDDTWKQIERIFIEKGYRAAYDKIVSIYEELYSPESLPMELAIVYAKANRYDKVMDMVEQGYKIRDHTIPYLTTAYDFEPLYDNPRFIKILKKLNLPLPPHD